MIAIIADIQGKLEKLEAFYSCMEVVAPNDVYVLGDVLQYGVKMEDNICVDMVRDRGSKMVLGNHEGFAVMRYMFQQRKKSSDCIDLDQEMFEASIDYFRDLPMEMSVDNLLFAHSIPDYKTVIKTKEDAEVGFRYLAEEYPDIDICFIGHSHDPACFYNENGVFGQESWELITLNTEKKYIVNPGALENDNYILFDPESRTVERCKTTQVFGA